METTKDPFQNKILRVNSRDLHPVNFIDEDAKYIEQLDELLGELKEINEMNEQMNSLVQSQTEKITTVETTVSSTSTTVEASNGQLIVASQYQDVIFWKKSLLLTTCTTVITLPVAVFIGIKAAVICGVGALGVGAYKLVY